MSAKRYIITGAPGTGKTSLILALSDHGFPVYHDAARLIIEQGAIPPVWISGHPTEDFGSQVLAMRIQHHENASNQAVSFFDRGLLDGAVYSAYLGRSSDTALQQAINIHPYTSPVFVLPPWEKIYSPDSIRREDFQAVCRLHEIGLDIYEAAGYQCIVLPKTSISQRIKAILNLLRD